MQGMPATFLRQGLGVCSTHKHLLKVRHVVEVAFLKELLLWDAKLVVTGRQEGVDVPHIGHLQARQDGRTRRADV